MATALGDSRSLATGQMICRQTSTNVGIQDARIRVHERALAEDGRHSDIPGTPGMVDIPVSNEWQQFLDSALSVEMRMRGLGRTPPRVVPTQAALQSAR